MEQKPNKIAVVLHIFNNVWVKNVLKVLIVFLLFDMVLSLNTVSNKFLKNNIESKSENTFQNPDHRLSKITSTEIDQLVTQIELISAIQVSIVEFQKNTREIVYTSIDNKELADIYAQSIATKIPVKPIFTNNNLSNQRMLALIYGEFVCEPFKDTIDFGLVPEAGPHITTVCSVGFPPSYGKFVGVVSIYTKTSPTAIELSQLRILAKDLSTVIHTRYLSRL